jgi:hypothetical protein
LFAGRPYRPANNQPLQPLHFFVVEAAQPGGWAFLLVVLSLATPRTNV